MALLGKISAVITANATDFTRTIGTVKSELNALQKRVQGYQLNLDTAALDKTLTKLQVFRRTLQEALGKRIDVGPLQDLYKVFEDIGKPLTKVKGQIESLSNSTQSYLYPALERAQKGFQNLFNEIKAGTTTFDAAKGRIDSLARQIERLKASTAVVSEFSRMTGNMSVEGVGAKFVQPRALEELQKFIALRDKASQLPAGQREDPFFQSIIRDAAVASERIEALSAKVERAKLRGALAESVLSRNPTNPVALASAAAAADQQRRAQEQLDQETQRQGVRNAMLSNRVTLASVAAMKTPTQATDAEAAAKKARDAINALRSADPKLEPYAQQLIAMAGAAEQASSNATRLASELIKLNAAADAGTRLARATTGIQQIDADARKRVAALKTDSDRRREAVREAIAAGVPKDEVTGARRRAYLSDQIGGRVESLQKSVAGLDSSLVGNLQQRLDAAKVSLDKLVNTKATAAQAEINKLRKEVAGLEADALRASQLQARLNSFDSSTAINLQPRAVKDYINDFQLLNNLAGNLNEEAGTRFGASLESSRAKVKALYKDLSQLPRTPAGNAAAEKLLAQIRLESKSLAAELVALDPTRFTQKQIDKILSANRRLRGDISGLRGSAMTAQLALQQLTFAVDDFFSSTGGFEYKLRAISNNISQLGFVLGNTKGLMAAVAATVGIQLLIQFSGIGKASKEAEGSLKFMNDELEKSRSLAEQNKKAFEDMAKAMTAATQSGARGDIAQRSRDFREQQKNARESNVLSRSPEAAKAAGKTAALEEQLSKAVGSERVRISRELDAARIAEREARRRAVAPRSNEEALRSSRDRMESARRTELATLDERNTFRNAADAFLNPDFRRAGRREALRREVVSTPTSVSAAVEQIKARLVELQKTQAETDLGVKFFAQLPEQLYGGRAFSRESGLGRDVNLFLDTEQAIEQLDSELARLQEVIRSGADDVAAGFKEQADIATEEIKGVFKALSSLQLDADLRGQFEKQFEGPAASLADAVKQIGDALQQDPEADISSLKKKAEDAAVALESLYQKADKLSRDAALGALVTTSAKIQSARDIAGGAPTMAGSNAARFAADLQQIEEQRRRAELRGDAGKSEVARLDKEIEKIRFFADELQKASIAVASFQQAAEQAALNLSRTLVGEAQSEAEKMRRRANRLASDPVMAGAAEAEAAAAEARKRAQEDNNRQLEQEIAKERLKFEREQVGGGRVAELAAQVRAGRDAEGNKKKSADEQLAGKQLADDAQAELNRILEDRLKPFTVTVNALDAARQAELEATRKRNEDRIGVSNAARTILGDNSQIASGIGADAVKAAADLAKAMQETRRRIEEVAAAGLDIPDALNDELNALVDQIEKQRVEFVRDAILIQQNRGAGFDAQSERAKRELDGAGVFASRIQGQLTALEVERNSLKQRRDALKAEGLGDDAEAVQRDIDAMDSHAEELNKAAIAVAAFQQAAVNAALELQNKVTSEAQGNAEAARRRANEVEAQFGVNSPQGNEARAEQRRREEAARAAEDERARADAAIAKERVKFEQEMADGKNPAAKARADRIAELERIAADQRKTDGEREAARAEAERLRREQQREFENRPEVKRERGAADEADRRLKEGESAARGRELMKTERQKAEEALKASAGDIANAANQMRNEGVRRGKIQSDVQVAANNLAKQAAPMLAGFAEEVMTARLAGPSRAALNATDVQTTEGAKELNRLLRGDDSAKDVNLTELRRQSQLLQAIEKAILDQANVVVEL